MGQTPVLGQSQQIWVQPPSFWGQPQPSQQNPLSRQQMPPSRGEIPSQETQPVPSTGPSQQTWAPP